MQFYPNFAPISTLGGMNLDQDIFQVSKLSEDQKLKKKFPQIQVKIKKKGLHQKRNTFFPQIQVETCAWMHNGVELLEGMQMKTILKLLGRYILPIPPWFRQLCYFFFPIKFI